jgi:hypothetical protein
VAATSSSYGPSAEPRALRGPSNLKSRTTRASSDHAGAGRAEVCRSALAPRARGSAISLARKSVGSTALTDKTFGHGRYDRAGVGAGSSALVPAFEDVRTERPTDRGSLI